jgi:NAD+ synthase (glutamine-hydrolysing)
LGPELEVTGYLCEDHFLEQDTFNHAWECLAELIKDGSTKDMICDVGMPVVYKSARYNCRVFVLDGRILLIRPKTLMADDGNYREGRYFTAWTAQSSADCGVSGFDLDGFVLPPIIARVTGQSTAPFGVAILDCADASIGSETCEEMFSPQSPHIQLGLQGCEVITNGSGSHHELRKLQTRLDLIRSAVSKGGGAYLYSNHIGCDGGRVYFDGCAMVCLNGQVLAQGKP